jgi:hypothetical protein
MTFLLVGFLLVPVCLAVGAVILKLVLDRRDHRTRL